MAESQAERLKKELRFLKDSYEAGIISEEEFTKGKNRIESKLAEWGEGVVEEYREEETAEKKEEAEEEKDITEKEKQEKLKNYDKKESKAEVIAEKEKKPRKKTAVKNTRKKTEEPVFSHQDFEEKDEKKKFSIWKLAAVALVIILIIMFFRNSGNYSINTDLVILNDERCDSCDTRSAENVIEKLFPGLTKEYINYNTKEGKAIYNDLGIEYLPAYIFKDSIEETETWQSKPNIRNSFEKKKEYYVLKPDQTGSEWKP